VSTGRSFKPASVRGGPPSLSFSPDGEQLLVCASGAGPGEGEAGCAGDLDAGRGRLFLIDISSRQTRVVVRGGLVFAGWSHTDRSFAYATTKAAFLVSAAGTVRKFAYAPRKGWPGGEWLGFSPDDRYIGLGGWGRDVAVLEVDTGKVRVLYREPKDGSEYASYRKWWR